ncbi:MAG: carboxymuconolactone decarboxylase family protein [Planctomycetales bacterium]|nr:carboxymuconolactone decarboxylase family protein [Planctomycetales bacterium]
MLNFTVHSVDKAPAASQDLLRSVQAAFGFVPNLASVMAESAPLLDAYLKVSHLFNQTSLTEIERQIVLLAASRENTCHYCMAAHCTIAKMSGVPAGIVEAIRVDQPLDDPRLEALREFTRSLVATRGYPSPEVIQQFQAAGFTERNALEVVLGVGQKTLSNYTNHLAHTPVDAAFAANA